YGDAPNALAFVLALGSSIKPFMRQLYLRYADEADALDDGPTLFIIRHATADIDLQIARLKAVAEAACSAFPELASVAKAWNAGVRVGLVSATEAFFAQSPTLPPEAEAFGKL